MAETTNSGVANVETTNKGAQDASAESVADKAAQEAAEKKRLAEIETRAKGRIGLLQVEIRKEELHRTAPLLRQARYVREYTCIRVAACGAIPTAEEVSEDADRMQLTGDVIDARAKAHAAAMRDIKALYAEERQGERCNPSDMLRSLAFVELYQEHLGKHDKERQEERNPEKIGVSHLRQLARLIEWDGVESITDAPYAYPCRWKEELKAGALKLIPQCFPRKVKDKDLAALSVVKLTEAIDQLIADAAGEGADSEDGEGDSGKGTDGPTEQVNSGPTTSRKQVVKGMQKLLFNTRKPVSKGAKVKAFRELAETAVLTAAEICAAIEGLTELYLSPGPANKKKDSDNRPTKKELYTVFQTAQSCAQRVKREAETGAAA